MAEFPADVVASVEAPDEKPGMDDQAEEDVSSLPSGGEAPHERIVREFDEDEDEKDKHVVPGVPPMDGPADREGAMTMTETVPAPTPSTTMLKLGLRPEATPQTFSLQTEKRPEASTTMEATATTTQPTTEAKISEHVQQKYVEFVRVPLRRSIPPDVFSRVAVLEAFGRFVNQIPDARGDFFADIHEITAEDLRLLTLNPAVSSTDALAAPVADTDVTGSV